MACYHTEISSDSLMQIKTIMTISPHIYQLSFYDYDNKIKKDIVKQSLSNPTEGYKEHYNLSENNLTYFKSHLPVN